MYVDIFQSVDSLILLRMQSLVEISRKTNIWERREYIRWCLDDPCKSRKITSSMHVTILQQTRLNWLSSTYRAGCVVQGCSFGEKSKKGFLSSHKIRCHVLRITARVKQRQLSWASHWVHMHEDYSAAIQVKPTMLIRTSNEGPLFYEFIFNLSFDPRLVCPSGFMLSPLGSELYGFLSVGIHMSPLYLPICGILLPF